MKEIGEYITHIAEHVDIIVFWFLWALAMGFSLMMVGCILTLTFKKPDKNVTAVMKAIETIETVDATAKAISK